MAKKLRIEYGDLFKKETLEQIESTSDCEIEIIHCGDKLIAEDQLKTLAELDKKLAKNNSSFRLFEVDASSEKNGFTLPEAIDANRRVESWVDEIKNAKVDGRPLTNFEKYLYAFEIITDFKYNKEKQGEDQWSSRGTVQVLNGDKIVCAGYVGLMKEVLTRLEIPCEYVHVNGKENPATQQHATLAVFIQDKTYGLNNILFADPTNGAKVLSDPTRQKNLFFADMSVDKFRDWIGKCNMSLSSVEEQAIAPSLNEQLVSNNLKFLKDPQTENDIKANAEFIVDQFVSSLESQGEFAFNKNDDVLWMYPNPLNCFDKFIGEYALAKHENRTPNFANLLTEDNLKSISCCFSNQEDLKAALQTVLENNPTEKIYNEAFEYLTVQHPQLTQKDIENSGIPKAGPDASLVQKFPLANASVAVFKSQGLSFDAASDVACARISGKSVSKVLEERERAGVIHTEEVKQELQEFAEKKSYAERQSTQIEQDRQTGGMSLK